MAMLLRKVQRHADAAPFLHPVPPPHTAHTHTLPTRTLTPMHAPTHPNHTPLLGHLVKLDRSTQAGPALANPIPLLAMPTQKLP